MIKLKEFMAYRNQEDCESTCSADSFLTTDTRMSDLTSIDVQTAQNNERAMRESIRQLNEQLQALKLENDRLRESQDSAQAELSDLHNELRREKSGSVAPKSALRSSTSRAADNDTFIIGEKNKIVGYSKVKIYQEELNLILSHIEMAICLVAALLESLIILMKIDIITPIDPLRVMRDAVLCLAEW